MATRLTDIDVDEISLVRKGANKRTFTILKADEESMKPDKLIKEIESLSDEDRQAVLAAFAKQDEDEGVDAILKALNPDQSEFVKAELAKANERADDLQKSLDGVKADLAKERERREVAKAIEDSRAFSNIPGVNPDDFGPILRKAESALDEDERKKLREVLKAAHENMDPTLLSERGSDDDRVISAAQEIESKAQELVKADPKLTIQAARTQVMKSHPDLAQRVFEEEDEAKERK